MGSSLYKTYKRFAFCLSSLFSFFVKERLSSSCAVLQHWGWELCIASTGTGPGIGLASNAIVQVRQVSGTSCCSCLCYVAKATILCHTCISTCISKFLCFSPRAGKQPKLARKAGHSLVIHYRMPSVHARIITLLP